MGLLTKGVGLVARASCFVIFEAAFVVPPEPVQARVGAGAEVRVRGDAHDVIPSIPQLWPVALRGPIALC